MFQNRTFRLPLFILLFVAAGHLSSCTENTRMAERAIQGRIDSAVRARLDAERQRLETRNDSIIVQEARRRADSARATGGPIY